MRGYRHLAYGGSATDVREDPVRTRDRSVDPSVSMSCSFLYVHYLAGVLQLIGKGRMAEIESTPQRKRFGRIVSIGIVAAAAITGLLVSVETIKNPRTDDAEVFA